MFNKIPTTLEDVSIETLRHDLAKLRGSMDIDRPRSKDACKATLIEREIARRDEPIPGDNRCHGSNSSSRRVKEDL